MTKVWGGFLVQNGLIHYTPSASTDQSLKLSGDTVQMRKVRSGATDKGSVILHSVNNFINNRVDWYSIRKITLSMKTALYYHCLLLINNARVSEWKIHSSVFTTSNSDVKIYLPLMLLFFVLNHLFASRLRFGIALVGWGYMR